MRRLVWVAVGAGVGIYAARRLARARAAVTPEALGGQVLAARDGLRGAVASFVADVRAGMAEREEELRTQLGLTEDGSAVPAVPAAPRHATDRALRAPDRRGTS